LIRVLITNINKRRFPSLLEQLPHQLTIYSQELARRHVNESLAFIEAGGKIMSKYEALDPASPPK
jgi:hypothetical protein